MLVIGGSAAAGRTTASRAVAARYGVSVLPVDAIWFALKAATDPGSYPELHYFDPPDEDRPLPANRLCERHKKSAEAISQAMDPVIEFYRYGRWPVIVEGAWITPAATARWSRQYEGLRAMFIHEPDMDEVLGAMLARSGEQAPTPRQKVLSEVCWLFGNWVREHGAGRRAPCGRRSSPLDAG